MRIGKALACLMVVVLLTGCGKGEEKKLECTLEQSNIKQVMTASFDKKDRFASASLKQDVVLTEDNLKAISLKDYEKQFESAWKQNEWGKLPYKITNNGKDTVTLTVDFAKDDLETLMGQKSDNSGIKEFKEGFEKQKYTCKEVK